MAVRKEQRKKSNLLYIQQAQKLCEHTFQLCSNSKHFSEQTLPNAIKQEALEILCNTRYLLSAATYNKDNVELLTKYRIDILAHIDALYALLELAYNNFEPSSIEYWVGLVIQLEDSIINLGSVPIC